MWTQPSTPAVDAYARAPDGSRAVCTHIEGSLMKNGKLLHLLGSQPRRADIVVKFGNLELDIVSISGADSADADGNVIVLRLNSVDLRDLAKEIRALPL
jgi:hypothetical protein